MRDANTPPLLGFQFPFRIGRSAEGGGVARAAERVKVEQNLRQLLLTRLGERVMLRAYGAGVHAHLQDPNDSALRALLEHEISEGLSAFMPEVELATPIKIRAEAETLFITMEYFADPSGLVRRLVLEVS